MRPICLKLMSILLALSIVLAGCKSRSFPLNGRSSIESIEQDAIASDAHSLFEQMQDLGSLEASDCPTRREDRRQILERWDRMTQRLLRSALVVGCFFAPVLAFQEGSKQAFEASARRLGVPNIAVIDQQIDDHRNQPVGVGQDEASLAQIKTLVEMKASVISEAKSDLRGGLYALIAFSIGGGVLGYIDEQGTKRPIPAIRGDSPLKLIADSSAAVSDALTSLRKSQPEVREKLKLALRDKVERLLSQMDSAIGGFRLIDRQDRNDDLIRENYVLVYDDLPISKDVKVGTEQLIRDWPENSPRFEIQIQGSVSTEEIRVEVHYVHPPILQAAKELIFASAISRKETAIDGQHLGTIAMGQAPFRYLGNSTEGWNVIYPQIPNVRLYLGHLTSLFLASLEDKNGAVSLDSVKELPPGSAQVFKWMPDGTVHPGQTIQVFQDAQQP